MANGVRKRRTAALEAPPNWVDWAIASLRSTDVLVRLGLCLLAAVLMWGVTRAWSPALPFRVGDAPVRDTVVRNASEQVQTAAGPQEMMLAERGQALDPETLRLLKEEHERGLEDLTWRQKWSRSAGVFCLIFGLYALCGYYIYQRHPRVIKELRRLATLLAAVVATVALATWTWTDPIRAEIVPILLFGMTAAIAYSRETALLMSACLLIFLGLVDAYTLAQTVVLMGAVITTVLLMGRIRTRTTLIRVGFVTCVVSALLTIGVGVIGGQPMGTALLIVAAKNGLFGFLAGFLMTGMLPFVENVFGVLTDMSLLELGDASHPLLQELVRRAPGTYNHSINVASIAEAAAESIGVRRLLVRVGAYFHDIGKMLKPGYFIENQGVHPSRHDSLMPAMSTLIIIAHVKDGADLARQHHLPEPIIDFIEQHHGTTLVEYFYRRASEQSEGDPDAAEVSESAYRYPGPKPQTREAAILMLADAVESASRTLVEPTPARIEGLVEDIAMKRLLDGQFDECGLTLKQLRTIEDSLIKSLTAVYHGRVKYPDQRTA